MPVRIALLLLASCTSLSTLGRARTIDPGAVEIVAAPGLVGAANDRDVGVMPRIEAQLAYGATRELELDLKLWATGVSLGARIQLLRSELDLALAPSIGFHYVDRMAVDVPLLAGWNIDGHQLIIGLRPTYILHLDERNPVGFLLLGGSLAFAWQIDPRVALIPEVTVSGPIWQPQGYGTPAGDGALIQIALGIAVRP